MFFLLSMYLVGVAVSVMCRELYEANEESSFYILLWPLVLAFMVTIWVIAYYDSKVLANERK
jgi:hypothetical protein